MESEFIIPVPPKKSDLLTQTSRLRKVSSEKYDIWRSGCDTAVLFQRRGVNRHPGAVRIALEFGEQEYYPLASKLAEEFESTIVRYLISRKIIEENKKSVIACRFDIFNVEPGMVRITINPLESYAGYYGY